MEIIAMPRGAGKTTHLIRHSALTGAIIVCHSSQNVGFVKDMARQMRLEIPEPTTLENAKMAWRGSMDRPKYLIDELELCLAGMVGGSISAVTLTPTGPITTANSYRSNPAAIAAAEQEDSDD